MGDPACFLDRTCLSCGRFLEDSMVTDSRCPHCGAPLEDPDSALGEDVGQEAV
jgi:hypothetical protein